MLDWVKPSRCCTVTNYPRTPAIYIAAEGLLETLFEVFKRVTITLRIEAHKGFMSLKNNGFSECVELENSIGVLGSFASKTFEGWLYNKSTIKRYGITCGHVYASALRGLALQFPIQMDRGQLIRVTQPSCRLQGLYFGS